MRLNAPTIALNQKDISSMFFIIAPQKGFKCVLEAILERACTFGLPGRFPAVYA